MIVWCERCKMMPIHDVDPRDFTWPRGRMTYCNPVCFVCMEADRDVVYPPRRLVGTVLADGTKFFEEVSQDEYFRICMGEGSTPKPDSTNAATKFMADILETLEDLLPNSIPSMSEVSDMAGTYSVPEFFPE